MINCKVNTRCSWRGDDGICNAPIPGNMNAGCCAERFSDLPDAQQLAYLLMKAPGVIVGDCSFMAFYKEAIWLINHGVSVEGGTK